MSPLGRTAIAAAAARVGGNSPNSTATSSTCDSSSSTGSTCKRVNTCGYTSCDVGSQEARPKKPTIQDSSNSSTSQPYQSKRELLYHPSVFRYTCYGDFTVSESKLNKGKCWGYATPWKHVREWRQPLTKEEAVNLYLRDYFHGATMLDLDDDDEEQQHIPRTPFHRSKENSTLSPSSLKQQPQIPLEEMGDTTTAFLFPTQQEIEQQKTSPVKAKQSLFDKYNMENKVSDQRKIRVWNCSGKTDVHLLVLRPQVNLHSTSRQLPSMEQLENTLMGGKDNPDGIPKKTQMNHSTPVQPHDMKSTEEMVAIIPHAKFGIGSHTWKDRSNWFGVLGPVEALIQGPAFEIADHEENKTDEEIDKEMDKDQEKEKDDEEIMNELIETILRTSPKYRIDNEDDEKILRKALQDPNIRQRWIDASQKDKEWLRKDKEDPSDISRMLNVSAIQAFGQRAWDQSKLVWIAMKRNAGVLKDSLQDDYFNRCLIASSRIAQQGKTIGKSMIANLWICYRFFVAGDSDDDDDDDLDDYD